mmetsp:Transcript_47119/g.86442  ORF Transcript_47119/g.86442 Transcript_47119/m.86442 type:complete len:383 (+) Transcript_47119:180-1328(+)
MSIWSWQCHGGESALRCEHTLPPVECSTCEPELHDHVPIDIGRQALPTLGSPVDIDGLPLEKQGGNMMRLYAVPNSEDYSKIYDDDEVHCQQVCWEPVKVGKLLLLTSQSSCLSVTVRLEDTAMYVIREESGKRLWRSISPFMSLVECNAMIDDGKETLLDSGAGFKVTFLSQNDMDDVHFVFLCTGDVNCGQLRESWMTAFCGVIARLSASLFPVFYISTHPVHGASWTGSRIMAGYLLRLDSCGLALVYCELQAPKVQSDLGDGHAMLLMYANELCERQVDSLRLTRHTEVVSWRGRSAAIFGVDRCCLAARSPEEKQVWLRAISNLKVKVLVGAPAPSTHELEVFREAVLERVSLLKDTRPLDMCGPLLPTRTVELASP